MSSRVQAGCVVCGSAGADRIDRTASFGRIYLVRTRSTDGAEAVTVAHPARMAVAYPIFLNLVAPCFIGRDARDLERLLWDVYRHASNYKLQGLTLWICVAAVEMSLLELMGQITQRPLADFFGGTLRREIPVYVASGNRGNSPESEVEHLQRLAAESGVRALKYRLGGRMSRNADSLPGRSEALIPRVREAFGDPFTLYVDANSSYDAQEGIRIGRMLEEYGYGFFEEPCEFDDLWSTKQVADALRVPVAGGEQEFSMHRWRWMIAHRGVDIVQPDLHYGGGISARPRSPGWPPRRDCKSSRTCRAAAWATWKSSNSLPGPPTSAPTWNSKATPRCR
jgi:L-alanine-DL-glutamate epimerase-like enolase superfamily enzyme